MEEEAVQRTVRVMARALARAGLSGAYGHCSMRLNADSFLVCAARPMGLIRPGDAGTVVPVHGPLPPGVLGEVRLHQQLYDRRPHVRAVCRFISANVVALAATGRTVRPRTGFGSYFFPQVPFWGDPQLVRSDELARRVIELMGDAWGVIVNVNGAVVAAETPERALTLAWNLEEAARVELAVLASGLEDNAPLFSEQAARERAVWDGRIAERLWDYLTDGDPEAEAIGSHSGNA
ncbi:MAG: class II aldolase/adducin family protein [Bradyrhizobium sp.]|nr:class II aldolase/adducin family protein [Bradyrhizobium sp.]